MNDSRLSAAEAVLQECFWGDYQLSAREILSRLERKDPGFERLLFSKIMNNSQYPSRHLRQLFPSETLKRFLEEELTRSRSNKRVRLVAANILEQYDLVPEHKWRL